MVYEINDFTTERAKEHDDYLIEQTDLAITELVRPKIEL
ncbi:MAG: hypothetical protein Nk1A_8750 [Endomicrobiia bacterium]|nr:MAG: hypothetical protein Nk1A_8750 [Endomicrobiia bacterium]